MSIKGLSSNKTNYPTATAFVILTNDSFLGPHPWCVNSLLLLPTLEYASSILWVSLHSAHSLQAVHSLNSVFIKLTTLFECAICFWPGRPENSTFLCPLLPLSFSHWVVSNYLRPRGLQQARLPVLQCLPEFAQTHVHWVNDATHPPPPLSPASHSAFNLS